ncbi:SHOCT domain-containing protein [Methylopila sp. M107]|uniref:SHOCT domain-containing protein n=1 Tax=Methylopila sp. M107 TaxID=1101190 RepID=UPI0003733B4E|nr:SHOCT domain-containing protein [Methylopila sp. M107]
MPPHWTDEASEAIVEISRRNGFGEDAGRAMADALAASAGSMAQFYHPDLGGMGQWSRGGMLMIGDMFNNALKGRVAGLAEDLAQAMASGTVQARRPAPGESTAGFTRWWPDELGEPSSTGAQNGRRYAVFPAARRLAIENDGRVTLYDTADHRIGGASQQQGGGSSLSFSTDRGSVGIENFAVVADAGPAREEAAPSAHAPETSRSPERHPEPEPAPPPVWRADSPPAAAARPAAPAAPQAQGADPIELIQKLATLWEAGVLTEEEFRAKKTELLARI